METSAIATTATTAADSSSRTGIADNFDSFLLLLTTQLQNQDPTSPMDADQFTQQLVQFSGVEQQIKSNETLTELVSLLQSEQLSQSVNYLGSEVETDGNIVRLGDDGIAKVHYELDSRADSVSVIISDEFGDVVATLPGDIEAGRHSVTWSGFSDAGFQHTDGSFKVSIQAETASGQPVNSSTTISGIVDGVELHEGQTKLSVDGVLMSLHQIAAVRTPTAPA